MADTIGFEQLMTLKTRSRASRITRSARRVVVDDRVDQLEAAAGRERLAGAPQQRHARVGVAVDGEPHVGELAVHVRSDRVEARARRA